MPDIIMFMLSWMVMVMIREALLQTLGGPEAYTMYTTEIGDATVLHGMIALTIFARSRYE